MVRIVSLDCVVRVFVHSSKESIVLYLSHYSHQHLTTYRALVYRSNIAKASLNPYWEQNVVSLETLCNGDVDREIQISVWDTPSRVLLGYATTTITGLVGAVSERGNDDKALDICKPSHVLLHSTTRLGKLVVLHASVSSRENGSFASSSAHSQQQETRQDSLSNLPQAVAVEILSPPRNVTFDDYMSTERCTLELCVAVDFTRANGACLFHMTQVPCIV